MSTSGIVVDVFVCLGEHVRRAQGRVEGGDQGADWQVQL